MVRIGIIGFGLHGRGVIAGGILGGRVDGAELAAVCDTNPEKLAWINEKHPKIKTFEKPGELLADKDVEAVVVATPHYDHPILAMAALDAGKHTKTARRGFLSHPPPTGRGLTALKY